MTTGSGITACRQSAVACQSGHVGQGQNTSHLLAGYSHREAVGEADPHPVHLALWSQVNEVPKRDVLY